MELGRLYFTSGKRWCFTVWSIEEFWVPVAKEPWTEPASFDSSFRCVTHSCVLRHVRKDASYFEFVTRMLDRMAQYQLSVTQWGFLMLQMGYSILPTGANILRFAHLLSADVKNASRGSRWHMRRGSRTSMRGGHGWPGARARGRGDVWGGYWHNMWIDQYSAGYISCYLST